MPEIPIIRIPFSEQDIQNLTEGWTNVLNSGYLTLGNYTRQFEEQFQEFSGAKYAVSVSNGTSALEVMIRALDIEGKSIIVPTNTFLASALAVAHAGNRVVFADSDPKTMGLDPEDVARKIDENTAAVMAVHIGGIISPDIKVIKDLCDSKGLYLLEDCAHAHGSTMNGVHAGLIGIAGGVSFFPTKTLTTGEGGMMITDNEDVYKKAMMLRNQGKNPDLGGKISEFGHNWRLSETTAVIGVQQMKNAGRILDDRRRIARYYDQALQEFKGIKPLPIPEGSTSSFYKYLAYLDAGIDRAEVKKRMREKYKVALPGEVYADLCHNEPVWDSYTYCGKRRNDGGPVECNRWPSCGCGDKDDNFPAADYLSKHHVCLPMYPGLTEEELAYVVESLDHVLQEMGA